MGGRNEFIGAAYIALGALSLAIALAFAIKHWTNPRKLGDTRFLVMQDTE
jgi:LEM3 (ligand-effect modulator 3) family / CDC50 family